jgi:Mce-associated membrane protein
VSGGTRQNAAETKSVPVNEDETPSTAAEIRALADQAEAEAAEAEALAAAARARARAIQLRRQAELVEAQKEEVAKEAAREAAKEEASAEEAAAQDDAADSVQADEEETREVEPEETSDETSDETQPAVEPEGADTEESPDEAVAEADADTSSAAAEQQARRWPGLSGRLRRPKWSTIAASLAIIVVLAALGGSGYMIKEHRDAVRQHQRAAEFAAAARQGVVTLTSLDFNNAKQGVQRILENSTGSFKDDFMKMADDFTKVVEQSKVVSQGTVQAAAVDLDTMTNDSAVVLVASTSEVTNAAGAKQDPRSYRLIVTVARDGGQLKISKVEFVP